MLKIIKHPLIDIKLTTMRDTKSNHTIFTSNLNEIASLMVYEILRDYQGTSIKVKTPTGSIAQGKTFAKEIVVVPILRAGLGMVQGILNLVPQAKVGHIGMYRNEKTFEAVPYFFKMPLVDSDSEIFVVDPMLASGVSAHDAITNLHKHNFHNIKLVCLVGAPEGVQLIQKHHPNVNIYLAALDTKLNKSKYIIPGLGDAGDRLFGTK